MTPIPVIIADDHPLMRTGIRVVLNDSKRFSTVAECDSAESLLGFLKEQPNLARVLILDMKMPQKTGETTGHADAEPPAASGFNAEQGQFVGLGLLKTVKSSWPGLKVLVLSEQRNPSVIQTARDLGANGYLFKDEMVENVIESLDRILEDEDAFSDDVRTALSFKNSSAGAMTMLTPRETQLLELLGNGLRDREIAEKMDITVRTVAFHKANLKEKLGAENTAEMIAMYHSGRDG